MKSISCPKMLPVVSRALLSGSSCKVAPILRDVSITIPKAMRHPALLFLFLISPVVSLCQNFAKDSCQQFFTGTFTIEGKEHIKIRRTQNYQYENNTRERIKSTFKIEWRDSCTYMLTLIRTTDKRLIMKDQLGVPMPHLIVRTSRNSYTYTTEYSFMSRDQCGAIRRHVKKEETLLKTE